MLTFRLETDDNKGMKFMKNLMTILIGSIFAGIIAQIVANMAGYNSKGIAMLIFLTILGISLIATAGSKDKKIK